MKPTFIRLLAFSFIPLIASSQSTVEYQTGAAIEVQTNADVSADNIITNSNYSGGGTFNNGPLPVEMVEMTVQATKSMATIKWRTESEAENYGFEVQRRVMENGKGKMENGDDPQFTIHDFPWETVGFVRGAGTSTSPRNYSFVDEQVSPGRYAYRIKQIDHSGAFTYTSSLEVEIGLAPLEFTLSQNYPNPFNPTTTIEFTLPQDGRVVLKVYDLTGREVATLVDEEMKAGVYHQAVFDASRLASGTYISRLEAAEVKTQRMVLVK